MRFVVQRYYAPAGYARPAGVWREVGASSDEPFARHVLILLSQQTAAPFRLIDTDSGDLEVVATIGEQP